MKAGLKTVVVLAFVLAIGFTLVILSCALWNNWLPLIVAFTFVLAPLPNSVCGRLAGSNDFTAESNIAYLSFGHFLTGTLVSSGFAIPLILLHSKLIQGPACWMSMAGGSLVYGTILVYAGLFNEGQDEMGF